MVTTRSQERGKPLKKEGAYDTGAYYAEKDEGYGDVGVDQEPDAGQIDDREDADFKPTSADEQRATEELQEDIPADTTDARQELEELKRPADTGEAAQDQRGEPVPIVGDDQGVGDERLPDQDSAAAIGV